MAEIGNTFLVADTQLYKRLCPSVRPSVCRSVRRSLEMIESKSWKTSVLEAFWVCVCVGRGVGCGWWLAAPAHPSATILWPCVFFNSVNYSWASLYRTPSDWARWFYREVLLCFHYGKSNKEFAINDIIFQCHQTVLFCFVLFYVFLFYVFFFSNNR